ncbi:MAG: hypothetical protein QOD77_341 [Thermoplasmata archaeon]|jgi:hypothetical protein|nr:hypothetical protein [Thermoplasmata archaeon]
MRTTTLALALLLALPAVAADPLPVSVATPAPQDCVSNQPIQAGDEPLWRYEDNGGSFVAGVRDDVQQQWDLVTNDCALLGFVFACNAIADVDPRFSMPACYTVADLADRMVYDGAMQVFGAANNTLLMGRPVCDFTAAYYGAGPWSCLNGTERVVDDVPLPPVRGPPLPVRAGVGSDGVWARAQVGDSEFSLAVPFPLDGPGSPVPVVRGPLGLPILRA